MSNRPKTYASLRDLCDLFGLTPRAIRFYEERGLLESSRDRLNWRRYDSEARRRLSLIAALRRADLSVNDIFDILELGDAGATAQNQAALSRLSARLARLDLEREQLVAQITRLESGGLDALSPRPGPRRDSSPSARTGNNLAVAVA
jgi:DNA-binding transcriptional MerR regulator